MPTHRVMTAISPKGKVVRKTRLSPAMMWLLPDDNNNNDDVDANDDDDDYACVLWWQWALLPPSPAALTLANATMQVVGHRVALCVRCVVRWCDVQRSEIILISFKTELENEMKTSERGKKLSEMNWNKSESSIKCRFFVVASAKLVSWKARLLVKWVDDGFLNERVGI